MAFSTFFSLYLLACASSTLASSIQIRSSPITLPVAVNVNHNGGAQALIERDRARAQARLAHALGKANGSLNRRQGLPVSVTHAGVSYTAEVGVGNGTYTLLVDTGSANTWVGANKKYQPGPNSHDTGETVKVNYGSGNFSGEAFTDDVALGSAVIKDQSIGVASTSNGLGESDGILGIGPTELTRGTTSGGEEIPTVTDNLASQGIIGSAVVGVSFVPTTSTSNEQNGEINFGAPDSSKFTGDIGFAPRTTTKPANEHWGVDQSITYGSSGTPILASTAGIVDTGTTLILLATDAFQAYQNATGAILDEATNLLRVNSAADIESLFFHIGGNTYELTGNAQIWPRVLNTAIGGEANAVYLIVSDLKTPSGQGLDFINGFVFLQRFYTVYDTTNSQVGFATTPQTFDTSN